MAMNYFLNLFGQMLFSDYAIIILKKQIPYFEIDGKNLFARCFDVINVLDLKNIKGVVFIDYNSIIMLRAKKNRDRNPDHGSD